MMCHLCRCILGKKKNKKLPLTYFFLKSGDGFIDYIREKTLDGDKIVKNGLIRLDNVTENQLEIHIDKEYSTAIINDYLLVFKDKIGEEEFFNEFFFVVEELHNVPKKARSTSKKKIINLENELPSLKSKGDEL